MHSIIVGVFASLLLVGGGTVLGQMLHRHQERAREGGRAIVYLPSPVLARYAALGHRHAAADYFWLQALQYYGDEANRKYQYRDLYRYIDLVVELDADFKFAYRFGATAIPYNTGNWTWHNVERSNALIEKGVQRFPYDWQLWLQLGFNRGILGTDYAGAAEAYRRAAEVPGSPPWIPQLVTRLYATAGAIDRARAYAEEIASNTFEPEMQEAMRQRILELEIEETLRVIDDAIARYREENQQIPESIELLLGRYLPGIPEEPLGGEYYIEDGEAKSSSLTGGRLRAFRSQAETEGRP